MGAISAESSPPRKRDPRLDFFRGIAMIVILVSHIPANGWGAWLPGRFGFSDSADIFVFCSGLAAAIAFGGTFARHGFAAGAARIFHRCWQLYWAHIAVFCVLLAIVVHFDHVVDWKSQVEALNLGQFLEEPGRHAVALMTLTYVPNYFDILVLYIVLLAMVPLVVALKNAGGGAAVLLFVTVLWTGANFGLELPADPKSDRPWFFNPFAWQALFFTAFALGRGWLPAPPVRHDLVIAAALVLLLVLPLAWAPIFTAVPALEAAREAIRPLISKTHFGPLRYVHLLALAYLAYAACGPGGRRLTGPAVEQIMQVGRQTLPVFLTGLVLARILGIVLDVWGRDVFTFAVVNVAGIAILFATAHIARFFKTPPWRRGERRRPAVVLASPPGAAAPAE